MRLDLPFHKLPRLAPVQRLKEDLEGLDSSAWQPHPQAYPGNSYVQLTSTANGSRQGVMQESVYLKSCLSIRACLAALKVTVGGSRLMRLEPGYCVPAHVDVNPYWATRVRVHIPIVTNDAVLFRAGDSEVTMGAGEVWLFDNWRRHSVINAGERARIHLVVDTRDSTRLLGLLGSEYESMKLDESALLRLENEPPPVVASPDAVDAALSDILVELERRECAAPWVKLLKGHQFAWNRLWTVHGGSLESWNDHVDLLSRTLRAAEKLGSSVLLENGVSVYDAAQGRLRPSFQLPRPSVTSPGALLEGT